MMKDLIDWSSKEFSGLPWRQKRSLYRTLVSEIMLQQTTVSTVLNHYERFLSIYPSLDSLADSTEEELTINWKGLGYYRRARNLHKACKYFQENYGSQIPLVYEELIKAPGIGEYTANAIIGIGANEEALCVDANLERVLSRINYIKMEKGPKLIKKINQEFKDKKIAKDINKYGARAYNESLMDLGRVFCQAKKATCMICPVSDECISFKKGESLSIPIQKEKAKKKYYELKLLRFIVLKENAVLSYRKAKKDWLAGQNEIPTFTISSEDESLNQYEKLKLDFEYEFLPSIKTSITKYRIINFVMACSEEDFYKITKIDNMNHAYSFKDISDKSNLTTASLKSLKVILD